MRRLILGGLVILIIGWFLLKDPAYRAMSSSERSVNPPAPDYYFEETWVQRPAEKTAGAWQTPWGVDVFLILPQPAVKFGGGGVGFNNPDATQQFDEFRTSFAPVFSDYPVYAPAYRTVSAAANPSKSEQFRRQTQEDILAAFEHYLANDNRRRALFIAAGPQMADETRRLIDRVNREDGMDERFGGVVYFAPEGSEIASPDFADLECNNTMDQCLTVIETDVSGGTLSLLTPNLYREPAAYKPPVDSASTQFQELATALSAWLDDNLAKPAEPFDTWAADEVIDADPIVRPGSERDISGERGN